MDLTARHLTTIAQLPRQGNGAALAMQPEPLAQPVDPGPDVFEQMVIGLVLPDLKEEPEPPKYSGPGFGDLTKALMLSKEDLYRSIDAVQQDLDPARDARLQLFKLRTDPELLQQLQDSVMLSQKPAAPMQGGLAADLTQRLRECGALWLDHPSPLAQDPRRWT